MNSFIIRNDPLFLRNEFDVEGKWGFPVIKKQELSLENLDLISCSDVSKKDTKNLYKGVHFFVDDFRFESLYKNPEKYTRILNFINNLRNILKELLYD